MTPEAALTQTVMVAAQHARHYPDDTSAAPWLVTAAVLAAQQAAALALRAAGDLIPAQAGATELLLRAASRDRLPAPFTLPLSRAARDGFEQMVDARNSFMHPRGLIWAVRPQTLASGLPVISQTLRHLIQTQPVLTDLIAPDQQAVLVDQLEDLDALAVFLTDP